MRDGNTADELRGLPFSWVFELPMRDGNLHVSCSQKGRNEGF